MANPRNGSASESSACLMARVEAMMECGDVFSEPAYLSNTDRLLDVLFARRRRPAPAGSSAVGQGSLTCCQPAANDRGTRCADWLNLPSLQELLEIRRDLVRQHRGWPGPDCDAGPQGS